MVTLLGKFTIILTVLCRDDHRGYCSPYSGFLVQGGTSQVTCSRNFEPQKEANRVHPKP